MLYTSSEANKLLKSYNKELAAYTNLAQKTAVFIAAVFEDKEAVRPVYDFKTVADRINWLQTRIRKIKHAINVFNTTTQVEIDGEETLTVDEVLVLLPQLNSNLERLANMKNRLPMARKAMGYSSGNNQIEYEYTNYNIEDAVKAYHETELRITRIQLALDTINNFKKFEINLD